MFVSKKLAQNVVVQSGSCIKARGKSHCTHVFIQLLITFVKS